MAVPLERDPEKSDGEPKNNPPPSKWEKKWVTLPNTSMRVFKWVKIPEFYHPRFFDRIDFNGNRYPRQYENYDVESTMSAASSPGSNNSQD